MLENVFVTDALRTPIGRYGGVLAGVRPDDLLAGVLRALVDRNPGMDPAAIEDVIAGAANQSGEDNRNVARMSALLAGLPETVAGVTVNRLCASGLQAIMDGSRAIACGEGEIYLAGGVESMSRAPYVVGKSDKAFGRTQQMVDTTMGWRFINPALSEMYYPYTMGETAENVAKRWKISREEQDAFALQSQQRYIEAKAAGKWDAELKAVEITNQRREVTWVMEDEHPRQTTLEALARLKPAFIKDGTVTAGNSSGINDGAAALLLAGEGALKQYDLQPMARVVAMAVAGVDPAIMGMGPVPAVRKALKRAGLSIRDIGLVELNEAFAAQSIACIRDLELDPALVNVNGGAIALGHPLGCSGARISITLLYEMQRRGVRYGIATMCIGVGQGAAVVYENFTQSRQSAKS
jgi:3-oxoadipyl-CoA thiolase